MFCKTCGTLLLPKHTPYGKWMSCPQVHAQPELNQERHSISEKNKEEGKKIEVIDEHNPLAVHDHICPKCKHDKAELIEISCNYSDEDNIYRMRCGKCGFVVQLEGKVT